MTGFTRPAFRNLVKTLLPNDADLTMQRGRPLLLTREDKLGLLLFYLDSKITLSELSMLFGISVSLCGDIINEMVERIFDRLESNSDTRIEFLDEEKKIQYAAMIEAREPTVKNCVGFIDGCSIAVQCSVDVESQGTHYNGYYHDTAVNNVFAFGPNGKIIYACINYPGSWLILRSAQISLIFAFSSSAATVSVLIKASRDRASFTESLLGLYRKRNASA